MYLSHGRARIVLVLLGILAASIPVSVSAAPAPGDRDYRGPLEPTSPTEPTSPADPARPVTPSPPAEPKPAEPKPAEPKPAEPSGEEEEGFFFEDLTEDPEALERELQVEQKEVKGDSGKVRGKVKDTATGQPLMGAWIEAIGTEYKTKTGLDGSFELELPVGEHQLRIREDTHDARRISDVVVQKDQITEIDTELTPIKGAGETVVVQAEMKKESAGARMTQRKEAVASRDIMSRDEIKRSGGRSTSAVANRIVGATVIDNKYLFVRGLGHRYGNTLLDGSRVPSPEPELRTIPLDIFPSAALSAINVQKTFTPDVPGDFAGASTQLETRDVPDKFVFSVGAFIGANTATTGRTGVTDTGYRADAVGFGNIPRAFPSELSKDQRIGHGPVDDNFNPLYTEAEIEAHGEAFLLHTEVESFKPPPNFGVNLTLGYGHKVGRQGKLGFLIASGYNNEYVTQRGAVRQYALGADGKLSEGLQVDYDLVRTSQNVAWNTLGLLKYDINKHHSLAFTTLYARDASDAVNRYQGTAEVVLGGDETIFTRQWYTVRSVLHTRLGGSHEFAKAMNFKVDWFGSYAQARREDPHVRDMLYTRPQGSTQEFAFTQGYDGGKFLFLDLIDDTESGGINFTLPFKQWTGNLGKVKVGAWAEGRQREFFARRFSYRVAGGFVAPRGTGEVLSEDTIGGGTPMSGGGTAPFYLVENTFAFDNYRGGQEIYAGYGLLELPLVRWFKIAGGARFEGSEIHVQPFDLFEVLKPPTDSTLCLSPSPPITCNLRPVRLRDKDWMPSVSLIFSPTEKQNIRLTGTRTVARPELREIAPFAFNDYVGGFDVLGNRFLHSSQIWNADLRWEWFASANEVVAVSGFYKHFQDPIERVLGPTRIITFLNIENAHLAGGELEVRKNLEFLGRDLKGASDRRRAINKQARRVLADFSIGGNFAYVWSRVTLPPERTCAMEDEECRFEQDFDQSTSRERPLQGQAPWVLNLFFAYDNDDSGTNARVLFNTYGPYIAAVGALGLPDIYQQPFHDLDFVLSQRIYKALAASFSVDNALNSTVFQRQGTGIPLEWKRGTVFSLGLAYEF